MNIESPNQSTTPASFAGYQQRRQADAVDDVARRAATRLETIRRETDGLAADLDALRASTLASAPTRTVEPRLLTTAEVAKALSLSPGSVKKLISSGDIESLLIGTARRIPISAVDAYVARLRVAI